jgi:hypothetical protein
MADLDIKKAVITAVFPKADLKDKDEAYISARYDSAVEILENRDDSESRAVAGEVPTAESRLVLSALLRFSTPITGYEYSEAWTK